MMDNTPMMYELDSQPSQIYRHSSLYSQLTGTLAVKVPHELHIS